MEPESDGQRLQRNLNELLQELRVAQAGVQILFAFLLAVAFTSTYEHATGFQRTVHLVTVALTTGSAALLIAPAAWHRLLFRQGRRQEIIKAANRFALGGLALLAGAMTGVVLLVTDVVAGRAVAVIFAAGVAALFLVLWFVLPARIRRG